MTKLSSYQVLSLFCLILLFGIWTIYKRLAQYLRYSHLCIWSYPILSSLKCCYSCIKHLLFTVFSQLYIHIIYWTVQLISKKHLIVSNLKKSTYQNVLYDLPFRPLYQNHVCKGCFRPASCLKLVATEKKKEKTCPKCKWSGPHALPFSPNLRFSFFLYGGVMSHSFLCAHLNYSEKPGSFIF